MRQNFHDQSTGSGQLYARVAPRLQAYLRDMLVYVGIVVSCLVAATLIRFPGATQTIVVVCLLALALYEPLLITSAGGTIGHRSLNLRVVKASDLGPASFSRALLRTAVKAVFGIPAFVAVYLTGKHQALHDVVAGTVVIPRDRAFIRDECFSVERLPEAGVLMPPAGRRIAVAILYILATSALLQSALSLLFSDACWTHDKGCSPMEKSISRLSDFVGLVCWVGIVALSWKGRLWGARRVRTTG